jgi:catechol 2,3-dioxygenase-like lactoylglutathione lyase family enzyme
MSLTESPVATMLPVSDATRAQEFYSDKLGLPFVGVNAEGSLIYTLAGGTQLVLLPRPDGQRADSTAMSFEVTDIDREIQELEARGVVFEDYDLPGLTTEHHVCHLGAEKSAWMLDPDGNVLCLHQNT